MVERHRPGLEDAGDGAVGAGDVAAVEHHPLLTGEPLTGPDRHLQKPAHAARVSVNCFHSIGTIETGGSMARYPGAYPTRPGQPSVRRSPRRRPTTATVASACE